MTASGPHPPAPLGGHPTAAAWTAATLGKAARTLLAVVRRRTIPGRALAATLTMLVLVTSALTMIAVRLPAGPAATRWAAAERTEPPPAQLAAVPNQSHRALAVAPEPSPSPRQFVAWALLDLRTGRLTGSWNQAETSTTASMIKVWIAADELRRTTEADEAPSKTRLSQLRRIIRDSDNKHAEAIFQRLGAHESIERLIDICELTDSRPVPWRWSTTQLSPRDTARMGACIADGRAAGPVWTGWLLDEMRAVRGIGDFGIRAALPPEVAADVAIKNGWVVRGADNEHHVNCLAIGDTWAMGVMTRYPAHRDYLYGAEICESLAALHLPDLSGTQDRPEPPAVFD